MNRRTALVLLVVAVALAGCGLFASDADDTGEGDAAGEFDVTAESPWGGVAGEDFGVQVTVENVGGGEDAHEVALSVDGDTVTEETLTLEPNETQTVTLLHTVESTGEYNLAVAGQERSISVYETPVALLQSGDAHGTRVVEESSTMDGVIPDQEGDVQFETETTGTVWTNYTAEREYSVENTSFDVGDFVWEETTEEWVIDDTAYRKETDHSLDEVTYEVESVEDHFVDDSNFTDDALEHLETAHTDDEYVLIFDPADGDASEFIAAIGDDPSEDMPPEAVTSVSMEFRIDSELHRPTRSEVVISLEDFQDFSTFTMTMNQTVVEYNVPVTVEVPDEVRDAVDEGDDS